MEFKYNARTQEGLEKKGIVKASSKEEATMILQSKGLFITSLKPLESTSIWRKDIFRSRISVKAIAAFAQQASVLLRAGTPIVEALRALAQQESNLRFKSIILEIADRVREGNTLSKALEGYPKIFSPFFCSVVKSGEASGRLNDSLSYIAEHLRREYELRSKIKGAMIYPLFVLGVFVIVFIIMMVIVVPNLEKTLGEFNEKLPAITVFILNAAHFFSSWKGLLLIGLLIGAIFLILQWKKTKNGKKLYDRWILKAPLKLGSLLQKYYLTKFCENLSVLIKAGLPISEALSITADIVGNESYKAAIARAQKRVVRGEEISVALQDYPTLFHPLALQMIKVGEKTGTLGDSLQKVVGFYQGDIDRSIDTLAKMIEPILILLLGGMVGILVIGIFLPIISIEMSSMHM